MYHPKTGTTPPCVCADPVKYRYNLPNPPIYYIYTNLILTLHYVALYRALVFASTCDADTLYFLVFFFSLVFLRRKNHVLFSCFFHETLYIPCVLDTCPMHATHIYVGTLVPQPHVTTSAATIYYISTKAGNNVKQIIVNESKDTNIKQTKKTTSQVRMQRQRQPPD